MSDETTRRRVQVAFGKRLQRARHMRGRKQAGLAQHLGLSRTSISNIERGTHRIFLDTVFEAARYLHVDVSELLPTYDEVFQGATISSPADEPLPLELERQLAEVVRQVSREGQSASKTLQGE